MTKLLRQHTASILDVFHKRQAFLALVLAGLLSACASVDTGTVDTASKATADAADTAATGVQPPAAGEHPRTADTAAAPKTTVDVVPQPLPPPEGIKYGHFPEDILTRVIMAEMAGQRGYNQKALNDYLALARETGDINIIKRASRIAAFMRDVPAALEMGNMWLAKEPDSEEALRTLAFQMVTLGRYREALAHMEKLLAMGADIDFRLISNRTAVDDDAALFIDSLIADFEDLYTRYPHNQSLRLSLAHLYEQNGQIQEAYDQVKELAVEMNDDPEVVILEVQLLEMLGEKTKARRRLEQSLHNNENNKQLRFLYGRKLVDEQRYEEAREQFSIIVQQNPDDYDMLYSLALLSMEVNMLSEAKQYFQRLVDHSQRLDDAHYYLGYIYTQENNPDKAIEQFFSVNGGGNFLQAQRSLTELMVRAGRYREVKSRLQNIRFRNPDYNIPLLSMEANVLMDEDHLDEAATVLNSAIGAFPNNIQLLYLRSVLSDKEDDLGMMETDLRKIIQLDPDNPMAYNSLGYTLADRTDRYEEAYELIKRAIELAPNDPAIIDSLGWVQYHLGMYEEARKNLDRAYSLFPDHEVAAHLGEVLWVMGMKSEARSVWRKALEAQPDSEHIRSTMERLTSDPSR